MPETRPAPANETLVLAAKAVGRIDRDGLRGVSLASTEEIEAMAILLAWLGLPVIPPDATRATAAVKAAALAEFFNTRLNGGSNDL